MFYKIYLITNLLNKKQYVGITKFSIEERFLQHTRRGFLLTEAIQKYGKEQFLIELLKKLKVLKEHMNWNNIILKNMIQKFLVDIT